MKIALNAPNSYMGNNGIEKVEIEFKKKTPILRECWYYGT